MSLIKSTSGFIAHQAVSIVAGQKISVNCYGRVFVCTEATGPFRMNFNDGEFFDIKGAGVQWALPGEDRYARLQFHSVTDNDIEFYSGDFAYNENVVLPVIKQAQTLSKPGPITINAGAKLTFPGSGIPGYGYRKDFIVTNLSQDSDLELLDGSDAPLDTIFNLHSKVYEISDTLKLHNTNAAPLSIRVMEIFYAS